MRGYTQSTEILVAGKYVETRKKVHKEDRKTSELAGGFGRVCSVCKTTIPSGNVLVEFEGKIHCVDCEQNKKHCVVCNKVFWTRINNKKTHSQECSRAWELQRAKERHAELVARALTTF